MFIKNLSSSFACLMAVLILSGCNTFYYKEFVVGGKPRSPSTMIRAQGMLWDFTIDVHPVDKAGFKDSVYSVELSILQEPSEECSQARVAVFQTVQVREFVLAFGGAEVNVSDRPSERVVHVSPCYVTWKYGSLMIPDTIDTVVVKLSAIWAENTKMRAFDTLISLSRQAGKEREFAD